MTASASHSLTLSGDVYARALDARDARFDGVFFVGITTTRIYCRPVCPSRISFRSHRRFFGTAAAAEGAGFRPCLRCRPELAPGCAPVDAVPRLAIAAARQIEAGALNGHTVAELASSLGVSERHLRRAVERELGVSPIALAQTHRLLLAKRLLADTNLSVTRIAFASGFQSLRRFNAAFRAQYRMPPSALVRAPKSAIAGEFVRLTLSYRPPLAWRELCQILASDAIGGVESVEGARYGRTITVDGRSGVFFAEDASSRTAGVSGRRRRASAAQLEGRGRDHVRVDVSPSLVPALMPLLARLRQLFDLDADPATIDEHLAQSGLDAQVARTPGIRIPGAIDGFDIALRVLLRGRVFSASTSIDLATRVTRSIGEPIETGFPMLDHLAPSADRIAEAGSVKLRTLGVPRRRSEAVVAVARLVASGELRLDPGSDVSATMQALMQIDGIGDQLATAIVMRTLSWPDAFPFACGSMANTANAASAPAFRALSQRWRPWRAYAAMQLWHARDAGASFSPAS
ncbi:MAG: helix-turn-helix domain-containing protein [Gemmatimonadota bacterium]|nr:helix-turn-helix domain-containing protein [Gemmatimonadota bacterium]